MNKSLHELLNMNRRQSTLKSVFISDQIFENCLIVTVEAYDDTGYNALNTTPYKFDRFCAYLDKTLLDNYSLIADQDLNIRVCIYGTYRVEYILTRSATVF